MLNRIQSIINAAIIKSVAKHKEDGITDIYYMPRQKMEIGKERFLCVGFLSGVIRPIIQRDL